MTPKQLEAIRARDTAYGPKLPEHYQAQWDRRLLLAEVDRLTKETE
jgi:hypothetical protein